MLKDTEKFMFPLDIQLFSEGEDEDEDDVEDEEDTEEDEDEEESDDEKSDEDDSEDEEESDDKEEKISKEAAMKALGITDTKLLDAVLAVNNASKKKSNDDNDIRVEIAELKVDLLQQDVKSKYIDDAIAIVQAKINAGANKKDAILLLKKNHETMFKVQGEDEGTGRSTGTARKSKKKSLGIGERLGKQAISSKPKKSFFE